MIGLGGLPGAEVRSLALGVSGDGRVIVGEASGFQAFRWTTESGMVALGFLPGANFSQAFAASDDGSIVVGRSSFPEMPMPGFPPRSEAFRWTEAGGMVSLGPVFTDAYDLSADGSVVVGAGNDLAHPGNAFFWTAATGPINLQQFLMTSGVNNLAGWTLTEARGVSGDGLTVVGVGLHNGVHEAFIATIPEPSTFMLAALAASSVLAVGIRKCLQSQNPDHIPIRGDNHV
jgi:uncharacterized membrane protein